MVERVAIEPDADAACVHSEGKREGEEAGEEKLGGPASRVAVRACGRGKAGAAGPGADVARRSELLLHLLEQVYPIFGLAWSRRSLTRAPLLRPLRRTTSTWESRRPSSPKRPRDPAQGNMVRQRAKPNAPATLESQPETTESLSRDPARACMPEPCTLHITPPLRVGVLSL
eukprot:scaffold4252_cov114-Isochrysis_galbana.AAC.2